MRFCPHCESALEERDTVCPHCGESVVPPTDQVNGPSPQKALLKQAMEPYYDAGYEKTFRSHRRAEMIKPKKALDVVGVVIFAIVFWPIALAIVLEHLARKDKRVTFELLTDGTVDITGDTLEATRAAEQQTSTRKWLVVLLGLALMIALLLFVFWNQTPRVQPTVFVPPQNFPAPQPPAQRWPALPVGLTEYGLQCGQDGVEAGRLWLKDG